MKTKILFVLGFFAIRCLGTELVVPPLMTAEENAFIQAVQRAVANWDDRALIDLTYYSRAEAGPNSPSYVPMFVRGSQKIVFERVDPSDASELRANGVVKARSPLPVQWLVRVYYGQNSFTRLPAALTCDGIRIVMFRAIPSPR